MSGDLWEAVEEEHEWFGGVSCRDTVELDPIGSHILVGAQTRVQKTRWRDCRCVYTQTYKAR